MDPIPSASNPIKKSADSEGFIPRIEVTARINQEQFLSLVTDDDSPIVSESEVASFFNRLNPIKPSFLIGEWDAGCFRTDHPGYKTLAGMRWAGTNIRTENDADPIVVLDDAGKRVFYEDWGHSSVREMVYRGVTSAAMIYDIKPIFEHFRYLSEDTVLGAMDCPKLMGAESTCYFFLSRRKE